MNTERKKFIAYTIAVIATLLFFSAIYWSANSEPESETETEPGDRARFIPGGWTPELMQIYNDSESIESLEYSPFTGLVIKNDSLMFEEFNVIINNESSLINELVILMIPEGVESRASLITHTYTDIWEDKNVVVGNKMKISEREVVTAYVFADMNVSNDLYDRHEETNYYVLTCDVIEVRGIDLTITPLYNVEVE